MGGRSVRAARGRCPRGMRRRAAGLRAHAQPDRAGRECVRRTSCSFSSRPGATAARATAARALPPSALASAEGSAGRDSGCEAKVRRRIRRPSGLRPARTAALNKVLLSAPAQPALLAPFSCNGSLAVSPALSASPSPLPRSSPPLSLPSHCLSAFSPPLSFCLSLARILLLFAQFQRLSVSLSLPSASSETGGKRARQS